MIINSLLIRLLLWLKPLPVGHFLLIALAIGLVWGSIGLEWSDVFHAYRQNSILHLTIGGVLTLIILALGGIVLRQRTRVVSTGRALVAALENISQGIMMIDADGNIPVINRRAIKLLELPDELMRQNPTFQAILAWQFSTQEFGVPTDWNQALARVLKSGGIARETDVYERRRSNGTILEVRTQPLANGGAVRTFTDITARKQTEEALATARDAAEAAGRARSAFLAVMSHEIRTPMNGVIGVAGLLLDMEMEETQRHYVQVIRDSGNHLLQLINDILDFSKFDAGHLQLEDMPFDLRTEVGGTVEIMQAEARKKGLALTMEIAPGVPTAISGDPGRLRQVLINLIGNSIKFTPSGSIVVRAGVVADVTSIAHLWFEVEDTGIGIPAGKIGGLFTLFTQVDSSVSRQYGGTGLGLAICRHIVGQMGGQIGVESAPGRGSVFRFDIKVRVARVPEPVPVAADFSSPASYRVLVAEDNSTNRLVVTRMLERQHHRVDVAVNGLEAVEAVRNIAYDLVLMDMMMPEMDGIAATLAIRTLDGARATVPIIGLTANVMAADQHACMAAGMTGFLTKPITVARLAQAIDQAMAGRTHAIEEG